MARACSSGDSSSMTKFSTLASVATSIQRVDVSQRAHSLAPSYSHNAFMENNSGTYIKKEEDIFTVPVKSEPGEPLQDKKNIKRKQRPPSGSTGNTQGYDTALGLRSIISQYHQSERNAPINQINTDAIAQTVKQLEDYMFEMKVDGHVTGTMLGYCARLIEAARKQNDEIETQRRNMKQHVLNCITQYNEVHDIYTDASKKRGSGNARYTRDAQSPLNTIHDNIESIVVTNDNCSVKPMIQSSPGSPSAKTKQQPSTATKVSSIF